MNIQIKEILKYSNELFHKYLTENNCELINCSYGDNSLHLSISKTFVLKYNQITEFVEELKILLRRQKKY